MRETRTQRLPEPSTAPGLKMHALYVAGAGVSRFLDTDRERICAAVLDQFGGFNVQEATGYFRGNAHPCLVVRIATEDTDAVITVGERIRRELQQEAVGLEVDGCYRRLVGSRNDDDMS
jgi:hypothetical protein